MKTVYKIPIIMGLIFVAAWPQIPHAMYLSCQISPSCSNDTNYVSGINFFGRPVDTNLLDIHPEGPLGIFALASSCASIGALIVWRIKQ